MNSALLKLKNFFSVEALDTRLQPKNEPQTTPAVVARSHWKSLEFKFYILACMLAIPHMVYTAVKATSPSNEKYQFYEKLLSKGWIFGRKIDNSDQQYRFFRDNFFLLTIVVISHIAIKKFTVKYMLKGNVIPFDLCFGFIFLFVLHGVNMLKILFLISMFYLLNRICIKKRFFKHGPLAIFVLGIFTLFFNVHFRKWRFEQILSPLKPLDSMLKGIVSRWDVFYNFMLLRIISFNLDYMEVCSKENSNTTNNSNNETTVDLLHKSKERINSSEKPKPLSDLERLTFKHSIKEYNIVNQFAYLLYAPLLIAGPVVTFNDFLYQSSHPIEHSLKFKVKYLMRLLFCILVMELLLHYVYVVALAKFKAWDGLSPYQISMVGLFNLNLVWLKLLIPWRFFRLWSLLDNIDPPENMLRCMNNNFSALKFWRGWHRSFNKWVIRYIYIPLGGGSNRIVASLCVFSFVAIWHDIELKLLLWGWMIVLFLLPEIFLSKGTYKIFNNKPKALRFVTGIGCVANIWFMMIANIFGFCLGADGTKKFLNDLLFTTDGLLFFILCNIALFIAVQVMFELREDERKMGIDTKC